MKTLENRQKADRRGADGSRMSIQHRSNPSQVGSVQIPPSPVHAKGTAMKLNRPAVLLSALLASTANAQVITETNTTLFPTPEQAIQRDFGLDVAAYGPLHIAVGAPVVAGGPRVGRVFVYEAIFGGLVHEIFPPEGAENPFFFGAQIEISGNTLVVSTSRQTGVNFIAEVYVYDLVTGDFLFELEPVNPLNNEQSFGYDIAIEDNIIAVGQPDYDSLTGCVYLYDATDGSLIDVIYGDAYFPNVDYPRFGDQVVLSSGKLAVAHQELALAEPVTPSVFIFDAGTSSLLNQAFPTPEIVSDDRWGDAIAMNDDTLIVCAPGDDPFGEDSGSAFAYDTSTGELRTRLDLLNITPAGATQPMVMDAEINDNGLVAVYSSGRESGQLGDGAVDLFDSITAHRSARSSHLMVKRVHPLVVRSPSTAPCCMSRISFSAQAMWTVCISTQPVRPSRSSRRAMFSTNPRSRRWRSLHLTGSTIDGSKTTS
jgi:hypothetical protein